MGVAAEETTSFVWGFEREKLSAEMVESAASQEQVRIRTRSNATESENANC